MTTTNDCDLFRLILIVVAILLLYMGYRVESGKSKPQPFDQFFPLFGRNIDYVLGTAGVLVGIGILVLVLVPASWTLIRAMALLAIVVGLIRPWLSPASFGPKWTQDSPTTN